MLTLGGMYGVVKDVDDDSVTVEISPGTNVRMLKQAIARRLTLPGGAGIPTIRREPRSAQQWTSVSSATHRRRSRRPTTSSTPATRPVWWRRARWSSSTGNTASWHPSDRAAGRNDAAAQTETRPDGGTFYDGRKPRSTEREHYPGVEERPNVPGQRPADARGLRLEGPLRLVHAENPVHWKRTGLDYTFIRLTFRRA